MGKQREERERAPVTIAKPRSPSKPAEPAAVELDGRRRRSQDSRARIVAAMLELVQTGDLSPSAEKVAARAQVGLRSVFRHFKDIDSLHREMVVVVQAELLAVVAQRFKASAWRDRVVELVHRRTTIYEKVGPFMRAAAIHRHRSRVLEIDNARLVSISRDILKRQLPPEISGDPTTFEALDLLLSFEAWNRLRLQQGLTARRAADLLETSVRKLLG
jgi:AcrR family transcriptional regulator